MAKHNASSAICPNCKVEFPLPRKLHQMPAKIACPHCSARLKVILGLSWCQQAEWARNDLDSPTATGA